jgi:oxygen-independent coproporphyrinogen-3 oxidase
MKARGLDRLSIGVQSFYDADLIYMNRAHSSGEAKEAIKKAQDAGFENLTIVSDIWHLLCLMKVG